MTTPTMTWTRLARALGSDHNPLRRRSDKIAAWLTPAAIAIFLLLGPLVAVGAIVWAHADIAAARQAGRDLHAVPAVLTQAVPGPLMTAGGANSWLTCRGRAASRPRRAARRAAPCRSGSTGPGRCRPRR
jgi:hypothetical protein